MRRIAAHQLEADPDDVELVGRRRSACKGVPGDRPRVRRRRAPRRGSAGTCRRGEDPGLEVKDIHDPTNISYSYSTHAAAVAVDLDTGKVDIEGYWVTHDVGTVINPMIVDGQVMGGVAQGIGIALYEKMTYGEGAQPTTTSFLDYLVPLSGDVPDLVIGHTEHPAPHIPGGMKGAGEGGTDPRPGHGRQRRRRRGPGDRRRAARDAALARDGCGSCCTRRASMSGPEQAARGPAHGGRRHPPVRRGRRAERRRASTSAPARCTRCWARTAPARARWCGCSPARSRRTTGELAVDGQPLRFSSPRDAQAAGDRRGPPGLPPVPGPHRRRERLRDLGARPHPRAPGRPPAHVRRPPGTCSHDLGIDIDPRRKVAGLDAAERKLIEIARALLQRPRFLLLDEPTAALEPRETDRLLEVVARLRDRGTGIILVTHRLGEVCRDRRPRHRAARRAHRRHAAEGRS